MLGKKFYLHLELAPGTRNEIPYETYISDLSRFEN